jgi:serine/threonine protein kinase
MTYCKRRLTVTHGEGVIHGDIKPTDVLVESDVESDNIQIEAADPGLSSFCSLASDSDVKVGKPCHGRL